MQDAHSLHSGRHALLHTPVLFKSACSFVRTPRTVHHVRDVERQRHERGDPKNMPEVRLMTFQRELGRC